MALRLAGRGCDTEAAALPLTENQLRIPSPLMTVLLAVMLLAAGRLALAQNAPQFRPQDAPQIRAQDAPIGIKVLGGVSGVSQYVRHEGPFWRDRIGPLSGGRLRAEIAPFDRSGIRGQEMLALMRLGVVPFGTVPLGLVATDEPELSAVDLPALNPDMAALRRTVAAFRPRIAEILGDEHDVELLGLYIYPAQVLFCARPFTGLRDLAGRRIRSSSVAQGELLVALGAMPVQIPFAEITAALRAGRVECAVTGTLSGNAIGLPEVTSHVHALALSWGVSAFGANRQAWAALPAPLRDIIRQGVAALEAEIWTAAEIETGEGLACNAGQPSCSLGQPGQMTLVAITPQDEARRRELLHGTVIPAWIERCGAPCAESWDRLLAPVAGARRRGG